MAKKKEKRWGPKEAEKGVTKKRNGGDQKKKRG